MAVSAGCCLQCRPAVEPVELGTRARPARSCCAHVRFLWLLVLSCGCKMAVPLAVLEVPRRMDRRGTKSGIGAHSERVENFPRAVLPFLKPREGGYGKSQNINREESHVCKNFEV